MAQGDQPENRELVYTLTNAVDGNGVAVFTRSSDGTLVRNGHLIGSEASALRANEGAASSYEVQRV